MTKQLDPEAQALLDVMRAMGTPQSYTLPVAEARAQLRAALLVKGEPLPLHDVRDLGLPTPHGELRLRLYRPGPGKLPIALFLHGGGWTLNDIDTHDRLCRRIAKRCGWLLASLDYRRAPEHRHPAPLEDAYLAYRWLLDNATRLESDPACSAVVGESSGATSAAALTLLLRDLGAPQPSFQVLAYPPTDVPGRWPSYRERGDGYMLDHQLMSWFLENYLPPGHALAPGRSRQPAAPPPAGGSPSRAPELDAAGGDPNRAPEQDAAGERSDPYLFPLTAADLSGLPPALVMTAEFDPLRDEGIAYAERLAAAGVPVEHVHAADQMHGFLLLDRAIARAGELTDRLADALAAHALAGGGGES
jgi:acetyl esterase